MTSRDVWASWLFERRHGGDPDALEATLEYLRPVRDRVLANADLRPGEVVLDVGTGDGLIAFGALERLDETGRVIFSDVSDELLGHCRELCGGMGELDRTEFLNASATDLSALAGASVDVVTTRSVIVYLHEKRRAFAEFFRVLRPGGRLSIFEPINRFAFPESDDRFWGYDVAPVLGVAAKVKAVYKGDSTLIDFDERDLFAFAEAAGFREVRLEYQAEAVPRPWYGPRWDAFLHASGNPLIPTLAEAMDTALTAPERDELVRHLRPLVERQEGAKREAVAYLRAVK